MPEDTGYAVTVDGRIEPESLGVTITHEHTFADWGRTFVGLPDRACDRALAREPVSQENLWWVRQNHFKSEDNVRLDSLEELASEVAVFHQMGGDTIVDVTPKAVHREPRKVRALSRKTDVNYVMGTAYYHRSRHPDYLDDMTMEEVTEEFVSDIRDGIGDTDVRAGLIGEIGLSGQIHVQEEKVLRAGIQAALRTGAPLSIHPPGMTPESQRNRTYPTSRWALEVLDFVEEEGLPPERVVMEHMDRTSYEDLSYQKELAKAGVFLEYDEWGSEMYHDQWNDAFPSDFWRIQAVTELIEDGFHSQLLFSHDIGTKILLRKYGGPGYAHILDICVPRLLSNGVSREHINEILIENPKHILTFVEPEK